jgi:hypothetical protein
MYRLFGFFIRREACRLAATAVQGPWSEGKNTAHLLWALTVFFESYLVGGSAKTQAEFGPRGPVDIGIVRAGGQK